MSTPSPARTLRARRVGRTQAVASKLVRVHRHYWLRVEGSGREGCGGIRACAIKDVSDFLCLSAAAGAGGAGD